MQDIEQLKATKNAQFKEFVEKFSQVSDNIKLDKDTDVEIQGIQDKYTQHKELAIGKLLAAVANVKPTVHPNAQI